MPVQVFRNRDGLDRLLVVVHLAQQEVDPVRPLEPPVAEQLGVVGGHDQRRPAVHGAGQPFDLLLAVEHEVAGVLGRLVQGRLRVVGLLVVGAAGDLVILDAEQAADAGLVQVRLAGIRNRGRSRRRGRTRGSCSRRDSPRWRSRPAWTTRCRGPGRPRRCWGRGSERRRRNLRPRLGEQDAVRVDEEVADAGVAQQLIDARRCSRTPAARCPAAVCRSGARTRGSRSRSGRGGRCR